MLVVEIQRGKEPMQAQPYCKELGATAACTRRLCEAAAYSGDLLHSRKDAHSNPEAFLGDSWFTGVKVCEWAAEEGHSYVGALKTSTKFTPYQELINKMLEWPSGSYLVMECTTPKAHDLICIGYKYSASKVLVFLGTKNSGSTKAGDPYVARFPDAVGNVAQRNVQRPDVISKYFNDSNVIDSHNQVRQYELALEKRWIVENCWFRVDTTLIGMTVTDCWRAYKQAMPDKKKAITIKDFADRMAYDCIHNCYSDTVTLNGYLPASTAADDIPRNVGGRQSDVSNITEPPVAPTAATVMSAHPFKDNTEMEPLDAKGKTRPIRRRCPACADDNRKKAPGEKKKNHLTQKKCFHPQCLERRYKAGGKWVFGVFYCPEHYHVHYGNVLEGNGNV
jgi:hypothetical protein